MNGRLRDYSILKSWQVKVTGHIVFTQMIFFPIRSSASISAGGFVPAFSSLRIFTQPHSHPPSESSPSDLTPCQWPGPRSIDLCFRFSAEACEALALGHWATVLSPANFHQSFAPPGAGAGTELGRAGPGPENEVPCTRPAQGHEAPAPAGGLGPGSDGHAVMKPAALQSS